MSNESRTDLPVIRVSDSKGRLPRAWPHCFPAISSPTDCASDYENEVEVGRGINEAITELGLKREDLWYSHAGLVEDAPAHSHPPPARPG